MQKNMIIDEKLKVLSPSLRLKKRFILIKINSNKKYDFKYLSDELSNSIIWYLGLIDFGKFGIWFLKDKFDYENQEMLIKVTTKGKSKLLAALSLINKIENNLINIDILKVSGTLKGVMNKKEK